MIKLFKVFTKFFKRKTNNLIKEPLFINLINEYVKKEFLENKPAAGTIKKYNNLIANITLFLKVKNLNNLQCSEIKLKHMETLRQWLHSELESCCKSHSARHLQLCKRTLKYAVLMEYIIHNPIEQLECKRDKTKEIISLERSELRKYITAKFENEIYTIVTHLYVYQCCTGLSYEGLYNHTISVIENTKKEAVKWVIGKRLKNEQPYYVPLFEEAEITLNIYNGELPYIRNATYNRVLKEVSKILGIEKNLTTHTARKTFATIKRQMGWSTESIADMLGHASIKTTETYYLKNGKDTVDAEFLKHGLQPV